MDYGDMICVETANDPCVITIDGGGDDHAGTGGGATYYPRYYSGGGGGGQPGSNGPGYYPATGSAYPDKESCRANVCMGASRDFRTVCAAIARNYLEYNACSKNVSDFYFKCEQSCGTADWSWLSVFTWAW